MSSNISNSKSDFYTSAKGYRDMDGMSRNFDFIDYSPKTKISTHMSEGENVKEELKVYRNSLIDKILALPGYLCPLPFTDFTLRGEGRETIEWNEPMLRDEGLPLNRLVDLHTICKNRLAIDSRTY